ncbi:MAG: family oxidoreductase [Blastococcus sp.]|jgi:NAD(P)-dependent dehydrogenase (short-subunit alcohol dehydrogenase family)|nr:family oxidoreductase [Blastococcus sp.]
MTALVTGAAHGIGAACARRLARDGHQVILADVDVATAEEAAGRLPGSGHRAVLLDAGDPGSWRAVARDHPVVDVVVNNAAVVVRTRAHELLEEDWDRQIAVDLSSVYHSVRAYGAALLERGGAIVNVASIHAVLGYPSHPAYAAAKGGVVALTRQLAVDYGPAVRVNAVLPGPILTRVWDAVDEGGQRQAAAGTALQRMGRADEVAAVVGFLASADASYVTGAAIPVDGGATVVKDSP